MKDFIINILKVFGVVFLRFRTVPRVWAIWLVAVNLGCLYFITALEAQVVLVTTLIAVAAQAALHGKMGFTRLLGVSHVMWVPMFGWMVTRAESIVADPALAVWIGMLFATNLISAIVDTTDVARYLRGDRTPHYAW